MKVTLESLREKLLKEFRLDNLPDEKKEELLSIMVETVFKEVVLKIGERLSDKDLEYFDSIFRNDFAHADLEKFINKIVPNPDAFVSEIVSNLRDEINKGSDTTSVASNGEVIATVGDRPCGPGLHREGGNRKDDTLTSPKDWALIENEAEFLRDKTVSHLLTESEVSLKDYLVKTNFHRDPFGMSSRRTSWSCIHNLFSNISGEKMFGFTRNLQRWGVNELKIDLLEKHADLTLLSVKKREEILAKMVSMILKNVFRDNLHRFSGVERDMLERMFDEDTVSLEKIEDYLRQKIPKFDKFSKHMLDDYYNFSTEAGLLK